MEPFTTLTAVACPIPWVDVDTDRIVPARFMSTPRSEGYGQFLFHDFRRTRDGKLSMTHPLDRPERKGAQIIVAKRNFGCGSSREAAVYALVDFGIRCVIAPSFGEIFAGNALSNGLLAARVTEQQAEDLLDELAAGGRDLTVDLEMRTISNGRGPIRFDIDPAARLRLLNGWDDVAMTLSFSEQIAAFQARDAAARGWARPVADRGG